MNSNLVLSPLSIAYAAVTRLRTTAYRKGLLKTSKLPVPVISVGNITVGNRQDAFVANICTGTLANEGLKVCILTRVRTPPTRRIEFWFLMHDCTCRIGNRGTNRCGSPKPERRIRCNLRFRSCVGRPFGQSRIRIEPVFWMTAFSISMARDLHVLAIDARRPWGGVTPAPVRQNARGNAMELRARILRNHHSS